MSALDDGRYDDVWMPEDDVLPSGGEIEVGLRRDDPVPTGEHPDLYDVDLPDVESGREIDGAVRDLIEEAVQYIDTLSDERAMADAYWHGDAPDEAEEGRANIIAQVVREKHDRMMPQLLRIFFAPEQVCLFEPRGPEDVEAAEQQSEVVQFVIQRQNDGYSVFNAAIHDATLKGVGIIEAWYERDEHRESNDMTGLTEGDLALLMQDPEVEVKNLAAEGSSPLSGEGEQPVADAAMQAPPAAPTTYSATVVRVRQRGRVVIEAVPPEQFLYTDDAASLERAPIVGRRRSVPAWKLMREGWDEELVMRYADPHRHTELTTNAESRQRDRDSNGSGWSRTAVRPEQYEVIVTEAYTVLDAGDGNGAVLRKFTAFGDSHEIVAQQPVPFAPFAVGSAYITPHKMVGSGIYRLLRDLQQAQTEIERGMLDSLAKSIDTDIIVLENGARMEDLTSTDRGRILREKVQGAIREMTHTFVGQQALPVLNYYEDKGNLRVGTPPQSAGLESDALQSSTKVGVEAAVTGGQLQMERIARNLAETLFKQLYTNVRNLLRLHQDVEMIVRLRNQYVAVDPRVWNADFDCVVNTAFGAGLDAERLNVLAQVAQDQTQWIQALGPVNPVTSLPKLAYTKKLMLRMRGFPNFQSFYEELPEGWQPPPPPPGSEQKSPEQMIAEAQIQIEEQKALVDIEKKKADIVLQQQKQAQDFELAMYKCKLDDDRQRDKDASDAALKRAEIEAKYAAQLTAEKLRVEAEAARNTTHAEPE